MRVNNILGAAVEVEEENASTTGSGADAASPSESGGDEEDDDFACFRDQCMDDGGENENADEQDDGEKGNTNSENLIQLRPAYAASAIAPKVPRHLRHKL